MWTSAIWWPLITYDGETFRQEVTDYFVVEPMENNFIPAAPGMPLFGSNATNFVTLLLRLSFDQNFKKDKKSGQKPVLILSLFPNSSEHSFPLPLLSGSGISWSSLKFHRDPEIRVLISSLPLVLLADTAQSTVKKYLCAFKNGKTGPRKKHLLQVQQIQKPLLLIWFIF